MTSVDVADIAEAVSRLAFDRVVIRKKAMKDEVVSLVEDNCGLVGGENKASSPILDLLNISRIALPSPHLDTSPHISTHLPKISHISKKSQNWRIMANNGEYWRIMANMANTQKFKYRKKISQTSHGKNLSRSVEHLRSMSWSWLNCFNIFLIFHSRQIFWIFVNKE